MFKFDEYGVNISLYYTVISEVFPVAYKPLCDFISQLSTDEWNTVEITFEQRESQDK